MNLPAFAIRRPVAVTMFFLAVVVVGIVSLTRMPVSLLPDVAFPRLVVWTTLAEVGPVEIETFVTEPVEETLSAVPAVRRIESTSREGQSVVTLTFPWGTDMELAQLHVRERLDAAIGRLPQAAERPTILRVDPGAEPILIASATVADERALEGDLHKLAETVFRRRLEQLDGVGRATVVGAREREIAVEVDPAALESRGLTIDEVAAALAEANASAPGGTIRRGRYRYALRALGEFRDVDQIGRTVVGRGPGGGTITVTDVATVRDTVAETGSAAYYGGRPSVGLLVYKESEANTVAAAERAAETLEQLEAQVAGVDLAVVTSQASFITAAIRNVVWALVAGGILAFLVLFPFLRDPRWPAAIAVAIPISIVAAFTLLYFSGVALDIMSLGGLALGVGLLVDNSIVVLENIFRHRERGLGSADAAALGAREVQAAITASTLTTMAVFGPILYVEGLAGALFGELALAVAFSLLASLLVALTLLPTLAARFGAETAGSTDGPPPGRLRRSARRACAPLAHGVGRATRPALDRFERGFARLAERYETALAWALDHRRAVVGWTAAALAVALVVGLLLPRGVLPEVDQRAFTTRLTLPPGTPFARTESLAHQVDGWLRARSDVDAVLTRVGRASEADIARADARGRNTAVLDVRLTGGGPSTRAVMAELRQAFDRLPSGTLALTTGTATEIGTVLGTAEADVAVEVRGSDLDTLRAVAARVERRLANLPMLADVGTAELQGHPELRISLDRGAIARHGLAVERVVQEVTDRTRGRRATEFAEFDRKVPIVVRPTAVDRRDLDRMLAGQVDGVPLRLLVQVRESTGPADVQREGQERLMAVTADVAEGGLGGAIDAIERSTDRIPVPAGLRLEVGGGSEELRRSFRSLGFAFLLAVLLVYLILGAQFESLTQPLVVLLAVPLALVGALLALGVTGHGLDTMSLIGIVILVGIAVNDAIIKIDFINQARARGACLRSAIEAAGRARLRPVVMTSVTTVLGLLPLAIGLGSGAELRAPLAVAVIGGMITSTALTLIVLPVVYSVVAEWRGATLAPGDVEPAPATPALAGGGARLER